MNWLELDNAMESCFQSKNQSIKQHGLSVHHFYQSLIGLDFPQDGWKIPDWFKTYQKELISNQYNAEIMQWYLIYHDCGKPFALEVDSEGKNHFPNHAEKSYRIWNQVNFDNPIGLNDIDIIGQLILHDMDLHTMTAEQVDIFLSKYDVKIIVSLLLASLAEIHSNASMWGGIESTSFKIKWKQLDRRGRQICFKLFGRN